VKDLLAFLGLLMLPLLGFALGRITAPKRYTITSGVCVETLMSPAMAFAGGSCPPGTRIAFVGSQHVCQCPVAPQSRDGGTP
jgi:hypothetical protein